MSINKKMDALLLLLNNDKSKLNKIKIYMEELQMNQEELNINQVAKSAGVSWDTARKYAEGYVRKERKQRVSLVDKCKTKLEKVFNNEDAHVKSKAALYRYLKREYPELVDFSQSTFNYYIRKHYSDEFAEKNTSLSERFETLPGEQVQFDYKEDFEVILADGTKRKLQIGVAQLGYSRKVFRKILRDKSTSATLEFLAEAFIYFGGVPEQIVVDNAKSLVTISRNYNHDGTLNTDFEQFCKDFEIKPYICMAYRAQTKGKVERTMQEVADLLIYNGTFKSELDVSDILTKITIEYNQTPHSTTKIAPEFLLEHLEKEQLSSLPTQKILKKYQLHALKSHKVDKTGNVKHNHKFYKVPNDLIFKNVDVLYTDNILHIYYNKNFICKYNISSEIMNNNYKSPTVIDTDEIQSNDIDIYTSELHDQALANLANLGGNNA